MKKYIKPSIEIVEADLSADCLQGASGDVDEVYNSVGFQEGETGYTGQLAPGRKGSYEEDDDEYFGW